MRRPAVLYHYPCPDGAFAALAAHLYFSSKSIQPFFFPNAVYSPVTAQSLPLSDIDELYLLDFVGPPGFVQEVSLKVPNVVVLDHHKTAVGRVGGVNVTSVLDMKRSGATIAFDYFRGKVDVDGGETARFDGVRRVFEYIEDGDLWRWRLPDSKAFSSGFKDLNLQYDVGLNPALFQQVVFGLLCYNVSVKGVTCCETYDNVIVGQLLSLDLECLISQGMVSLSEKQKLIEEALSQSYEIKLGGGAFGHCLVNWFRCFLCFSVVHYLVHYERWELLDLPNVANVYMPLILTPLQICSYLPCREEMRNWFREHNVILLLVGCECRFYIRVEE